MKPKRLLFLSAQQMTAYLWQSGELTDEGQFAPSETGYLKFAAYLAQHSGSVFSVLTNVSEEGFHIEAIPFLKGSDRKAVIRRKLGQLFFSATLTAASSLGYEKTRRKDERIMLAALTNNDFFDPWLDCIDSTGVALSGIFSLPLLAPSLFRKLHISEAQCLLLTVQDQTIRQSYFENGELVFSRLAPLQDKSMDGIAHTISSEAPKLHQYLASQRLIGRKQPVTTYILAHQIALKSIQTHCVNTETIHYSIISMEDCARKTRLKTLLQDTHCEKLFLNLLLTSPSRIQFANDDQRHVFHLGQIRTILHSLGALALLGCLLFSGKLLFDVAAITQEKEALKIEADTARQHYADIIKTFPPIPTDTDTLQRVIDRYVVLEKGSISPDGLYHEISRALQLTPPAELLSIDWRVGGVEIPATATAGQVSAAALVLSDSEAAIVRGTLKLGPNANPRQMLGAFNALVEALKSNPKLQVNVLQRPFDIESGKSLKGGDTTVEDNTPRAFTLQVVRKLGS